MSKIYVIGHKSPDTDSIMSALVYSRFLQDKGQETEAVKIGKINKESEFILDNIGVKKPRRVDTLSDGSNVFLVDHNEKKQTINNIDNLNIIGVIDHHNFGSFDTKTPIFVRTEPLGCTCSILYKIFKENNYLISIELAKMMISAIISDTLFFRSPTTTKEDKNIVIKLNEIAKIDDLEKYSINMFDAKSDLGDISAKELVKKDFKRYDIKNKRLAVGVMETTNSDYGLGRKNEILTAMEKIKEEKELDFILFCIIDILNQKNIGIILSGSDEKIIYNIFKIKADGNLLDLGNRISRKKQIIPFLLEYFDKL